MTVKAKVNTRSTVVTTNLYGITWGAANNEQTNDNYKVVGSFGYDAIELVGLLSKCGD